MVFQKWFSEPHYSDETIGKQTQVLVSVKIYLTGLLNFHWCFRGTIIIPLLLNNISSLIEFIPNFGSQLTFLVLKGLLQHLKPKVDSGF